MFKKTKDGTVCKTPFSCIVKNLDWFLGFSGGLGGSSKNENKSLPLTE